MDRRGTFSDGGLDGAAGLAMQLRAYPALATNRSYVIESAVQEFERLSRHHPGLSLGDYCRQFAPFGAALQSSIYRQLEVERVVAKCLPDQVATGDDAWPAPGDELGSCVVIEEIGRGAWARVYLCRQPDLGDRQVVVKLGGGSRLEAHTLGRLNHPNIVPMHSADIDPLTGKLMLCMPFLGRSTLHDLIDLAHADGQAPAVDVRRQAATQWDQPTDASGAGAPPPPATDFRSFDECVADIGAKLADALAHAHAEGILHGDIKPSNILLSRQGVPLLVDFNLSGNSALDVTARGGTLPYMPPEQLRVVAGKNSPAGVPCPYDRRSDIFSLGVVLYELTCGRLPFPLEAESGDTKTLAADLLERQRNGWAPLQTVNRRVSRSLAQTIEACLALRPEERIASAAQLSALLRAEINPFKRARRRIAARPLLSSAVAACLLAAVSGWASYAMTRPPEHVQQFERGIALREVGRLEEAEIALQRALALSPSYLDARFELAHTLMARGDFDRARDFYHDVFNVRKDPRSMAYLGYCFACEGNFGASVPWWEMVVDAGAATGEVYHNLAVALSKGANWYSRAERIEMAEDLLEQALEQLPDSPTVKLSWIMHDLRKLETSQAKLSERTPRFCRELCRQFPDDVNLHYNAASAFVHAYPNEPARLAQGVTLLQRAVELGLRIPAFALRNDEQWKPYWACDGFPALVDSIEDGSLASSLPQSPQRRQRIPRLLEPVSVSAVPHANRPPS
jgi:serine/threonine protein kinase